MMQDFEVIRSIVNDGVIYIPAEQTNTKFGGAALASSYFLAGSVIEFNSSVFAVHSQGRRSLADYVITRQREESPALLTPDNRQIFLYHQNGYSAQIEEMIGQAELLIRRDGYFDVYRSGNSLIYVRHQGEARAARFIRPDIPIVGQPCAVTLSPAVRRAGFTDESRWQWERGSDAAGWTNVSGSDRPGPTHVYTPTTGDEGYQLRASVDYTDRRGNRVKAMTVPSLPVQPSSVTYMGFFLHLIPVDMDDLPDHRKQYNFDNLDFRFGDYELLLTERAVAVRELPAYDIAGIRTGQFLVDEDGSYTHLWEGEVRFDE